MIFEIKYIFIIVLTSCWLFCSWNLRYGSGNWTPKSRRTYNLYDPVVRSTVQVINFLSLTKPNQIPNTLAMLKYHKINEYFSYIGVSKRMDSSICVFRQSRDVEFKVTKFETLVLRTRALYQSL